MTTYWLALNKIKVENANSIAGIIWGFPAITHFVGFSHLLSRHLEPATGLRVNGCCVIVHKHQVYGDRRDDWFRFAQSRNPLTKEGETAPIVQEGRMRIIATLLMPCSVHLSQLDTAEVEAIVKRVCWSKRLAGGMICDFQYQLLTEPEEFDERALFHRKTLLKTLPGFALVERAEYLAAHHAKRLEQDASAELLDSWLDFSSLRTAATTDDDGNVEWKQVPKPQRGWLVPINIGYQAISETYPPGEVAGARSEEEPFRFVEPAYTIGEWISPHRVKELNDLVWRYNAEPELGRYFCCNTFTTD